MRHDTRFRLLTVRSATHLTPHMVRVTLAGDELQGFASPGFDDHVKLFFPDAATGRIDRPSMGPDGINWPGPRPQMRDYTPRHYDAAAGTLTIDFALHDAGPATRWAEQAQPGQTLGVGGPRGSMLIPAAFDGYLLIGDDTALPAIARRLEELPAGAPVTVLAEVDSPADEIAFSTRTDLRITWVHRQGAAPGSTSLLLDALPTLALPPGDFHTWIACETGAAKQLRASLIAHHGARPAWTKAAGYWRVGSADAHERIE
ncbi:siderophore-interacting protein [Xylophilus sp. GW821-FHT01B05]